MPVTLPAGPYEPTWESLCRYETPEWYLDAKFGIFIHWGAYSVPAFGNEWYPRNMYRQGSPEFEHHVRTYGTQDGFGYKDLIPRLTAESFRPEDWADLFHRAGAKYVVPVAEHHDGFQMYDSALCDWCATKVGPKRDVVGELAREVRAKGMVYGVSSHRAEHWWFMNGGMEFDSDVRDPAHRALYGPARPDGTQPDEEFLDDWLARCCELVDKYRPQVFWFDWWIEQPAFAPYLRKFAAYYYNRAAQWGAGVAINYKNDAYPVSAAVFDVERGQLDDSKPYFWQTDTSISKNSWGYVHGQDYKTAESIVHDLCDIVSKNGCLLLNVGPRPDGIIPPAEQDALLEIGEWLGVNGEAIYESRPWRTYGEGPTDIVAGSFHDTERPPFTGADMRFTTKGDAVYAILLGWPEGGDAAVRSLATSMKLRAGGISRVEMLGSPGALEWTRDAEALRVRLPVKRPCKHAWVLRIE